MLLLNLPLTLSALIVIVLVAIFLFLLSRYKRCPSNKILVIYGKVGTGKSAKCIHGGGAFILPVIQDYGWLDLTPLPIEIQLKDALSKQNIRIHAPATFTVAVSTKPDLMLNAAERLLGLSREEIRSQAIDIILGQMRLVIATLTIEEINQDRERFLHLVNEHVNTELNKIGLELINVNIIDITDASGYIEALGQKAAAEAMSKARVEVAEQEKLGATGEKQAEVEKRIRLEELETQAVERELEFRKAREIAQALQQSEVEQERKRAEVEQRIRVEELETQAVKKELQFKREREVAAAIQKAQVEQERKRAEAEKRIQVAALEAKAFEGEAKSEAEVIQYKADLAVKRAQALQESKVAEANAQKSIIEAQKEAERKRLEKETIIPQEIEKEKERIKAQAEAIKILEVAQGKAKANFTIRKAEADAELAMLQAKAKGFEEIVKAAGGNQQKAATLLIVERLEELVKLQVSAISNLKIDKITVWESGNGNSSTQNFIRSLAGSLPPIHELARQAGVELPEYLGKIKEEEQEKDSEEG